MTTGQLVLVLIFLANVMFVAIQHEQKHYWIAYLCAAAAGSVFATLWVYRGW